MKHAGQDQTEHKGLLARWLDSIMESRMRHVQHEVDMHLPFEQRAKLDSAAETRDDEAQAKPH
jgi:hypothetical protein